MTSHALSNVRIPTATDLRRWLTDEEELAAASWRLLTVFVLSIPFSIALAQTLLSVTVAVALRHWWIGGRGLPRTPLDLPIACFLATAVLAALVGLDARQGLWGARTYLQVLILYLVVAYARTDDRLLQLARYFLIAMAVTSAHTVITALSPWRLPNPFPGQMTESGQLLFAIGLSLSLWLHRAMWPRWMPWAAALHVLALIINLKRGVWLGAIATVLVLGLVRSRRLILITIAAVAIIASAVPTVRTRIENTARDLYLPGNRHDIWAASVDVIRRFPLGIGRKNGTILRDYPNIPPNHKHAHNNFLQITMEFGVLGLAAFAWWMGAFGWLAWQGHGEARRGPPAVQALALAVFATFIGFHVAGLVEYNFGDTEVLEVVFVMMGIGIAIRQRPVAPNDA